MGIDSGLAGRQLGSVRRSWDAGTAILYALGVGAGALPGHGELAFTTENSAGTPFQVLPTYASVLGFPALALTGNGAGGAADIFGGFPPSSILHGGQRLAVHAPLPVEGAADVSAVVADVHDAGGHALVTVATEATDVRDGRLLAGSRAIFLVRGAGGFGGPRPQPDGWLQPRRAPDHMVEYVTSPAQGLLYRLSGDRNRLHSDPAAAREAGFDGPILQGLCTWGFAGRALLHAVCGGNAAGFGAMAARFTSPVMPGECLAVRLWDCGTDTKFQVLVGDRVVMDRGLFTRNSANGTGSADG
ncbi:MULTISPECIES: MaoC/PaaZ C-terminal domain-containing protein [unclassified Arthrobacter]|uniref:MaoC/PaaZ C-terminal domain-containing protein n=1 Tax=unclassified Arthrobacter TaxID=235627 RepID=UPI00159E6912|nr:MULTISPECIES: MaoC/PaaZ C-terminal domain-containing protein [unclassified Arthrobacter]MCQ9165339.1 MaoC family dehydratase N-terminal domain-containing protein [Arthrobacter sp. STN4]NVN00136.1 enoyl-CoA hydratase [Arthrobacter sp. SDTb3-6]